jgi:DNA polymerase III epsilon subunit-like protein
MSKKICFIHTETTGLHDLMNDKVYKKNLFGFARMVSFSWIIATRNNIIKKEHFIIKPRCLQIPDDCVKFHGISQEIALKKGKEIETILTKFKDDLVGVDIICSHGLEFHLKTVQAELVRYNKAMDFNKFLLIDTNSSNDLMFSQMFAPRGEKTLFLEDKRMIKFIYLTIPNNTKFGYWHITIG